MKKTILIIALITGAYLSTSSAQGFNHNTNPFEIVDSSYTALHQEEVRQANAFRFMINTIIEENLSATAELRTLFYNKIYIYFMPADTGIAKILLNRVDTDTSMMKECRYILDVKSKWLSTASKHFVFYYPDGKKPDGAKVIFWDNQYERISSLFNTQIKGKITFVIDPSEQYGRAYAPWDINMGIRQKELDGNPHELVHVILFKYSDVPFFHEPLAFIYGTSLGNMGNMREKYLKYVKTLQPNKYVSASELIHFPQIIGLDDIKWASAFCFVYKLNEKFGLEKLLSLMAENTWKDSANNLENSFRKIYGVELKLFEEELMAEISK